MLTHPPTQTHPPAQPHEHTHAATPAVTARLRATGARLTAPRQEVLSLLMNSSRALSHGEIEAALAAHAKDCAQAPSVDRVTLYRVLDWLTAQHLAHKIADADRVTRFSVTPDGHDEAHAHFKCVSCGNMLCLTDVPPLKIPVPAGFASNEIEVTVRGVCATCNQPKAVKKRAGQGSSKRAQ